MRSISLHIIQLILCVFLAACGAQSVHAWDFPLDLSPLQMKFNHGYAGGAFDIRVNANTNITVPEYYAEYSRFAYKIGSSPKVLVKFWTDSPDSPTLTIDAVASGDTSWELTDKTMSFNLGNGLSVTDPNYSSELNYQMFDTASGFPSTVDKYEFSWTWRVVAVDGTPRTPETVGTTTGHILYTVLDTPQSPMSEPWTEVLEKACRWADGASSVSEIITGITSGAYNGNFKNYSAGVTHCSPPNMYLTNLFNDTWADCRDMSAVIQIFSNALGVSYYYVGYQRINGPFRTKSIDPIGSPAWQTITWAFHQVGWYNNSVYDAALRLDESSARIPMGEGINGSYKDDLYDATHPDTVRWDPQGASYLSGTVY